MNRSKKKGSAYEVSLLPALRKLDSRVERSALKGSKDAGDFTKLRYYWAKDSFLSIAVSAKNCKQIDLSGWLKEAESQRKNAAADVAIVVHKKRGVTAPEAQYVTLTLGALLKLLR